MKGSRDSCCSTFPKHCSSFLLLHAVVNINTKFLKFFNFQNEGEFSCVVCIILCCVYSSSFDFRLLSIFTPPPPTAFRRPSSSRSPPPYIYHLIYHILTILTPIHSTSSILNKSSLNSSPSLSLQSLLPRLLRPASSASRPTPLTTATPQRAACPMR